MSADPFKSYGDLVGELTAAQSLIRTLVEAGQGVIDDSGAAGAWANLCAALALAQKQTEPACDRCQAPGHRVVGSADVAVLCESCAADLGFMTGWKRV